MSDLRKAAEMALEVFDGPVLKDATEHAMRLRKACDLLRQALAQPEHEPTTEYLIGAEIASEDWINALKRGLIKGKKHE